MRTCIKALRNIGKRAGLNADSIERIAKMPRRSDHADASATQDGMDGAHPAVEPKCAEDGHPDQKRVRGKPYSAEDCAIIRNLYEVHNWKAPRVVRENPSKGWTNTGVKKISQKIKSGTPLKTQAGGRPA